MSSKTRALTCANKKMFTSKSDARDAMISYSRKKLDGLKMNAEVYPCGNHYHWGHYSNKSRRKGLR